jgi:hypothetical protein
MKTSVRAPARQKKKTIIERPALHYQAYPDGSLHLLNGIIDTEIVIKRSHEEYNHFACWYVTDGGKIKKDYPLKEKDAALAKGMSLHLDKLSSGILKKHGGGNG